MVAPDATPLDLRELFAARWEGIGELWCPAWLQWLPLPTTFRFRSEILNATADAWDVLDTMTFPDGSTQQRRTHCRLRIPLRHLDVVELEPDGTSATPSGSGPGPPRWQGHDAAAPNPFRPLIHRWPAPP